MVSDQFNLLVKIRDPVMERKATYGISNADYRQIGGIKLFQVIETLDDNVTSDKDFLEEDWQRILWGKSFILYS